MIQWDLVRIDLRIIYNLLRLFDDEDDVLDGTYYKTEPIMSKVPKIISKFKQAEVLDADRRKQIDEPDSNREIFKYPCFVKVGEDYWFSVEAVCQNPEQYSELLSVLGNCKFRYKRLYFAWSSFCLDSSPSRKLPLMSGWRSSSN
jgi:hypothetical protein